MFILINNFRHLKLEIALAIPATNELKIQLKQFSNTRVSHLTYTIPGWQRASSMGLEKEVIIYDLPHRQIV